MLATKPTQCEPRRPERRAREYMRHAGAEQSSSSAFWREAVEQRTIHKSPSIKESAKAFIRGRKNRRAFICYPTIDSLHCASEFAKLCEVWQRDTKKLSMLHRIILHPAYQQIIGMGDKVLPHVFKEFETHGGQWIWALSAITGNWSVPQPGATFRESRQAWLSWGRENGYL